MLAGFEPMNETTDDYLDLDGLRLHYLAAGDGEPIVLLHGWPTSSFLWRNVMPVMAERHRVIALDLPGFGLSDKPLDVSYSFRYYYRVLDEALNALGIEAASFVVHDLGGPVGLYWACRHPERLRRLAILNTLVYPDFSWAVMLFVAACRLPVVRSFMASPQGLRFAMRLGVADPRHLSEEAVVGVQTPFASLEARRALLKAGGNLSPKGFREIAAKLPTLDVPVRIVYGERDRILPDVAKTMHRIQKDLPQAEITALADCGHFLQEERPAEVGRLLADFFNKDK